MSRVAEIIKPVFVALMAMFLSVICPVEQALYILLFAACFNWFTGLVTDIHVNKAQFSLKKAFDAISQLMWYSVVVVFVNFALVRMGDRVAADQIVKWITYIVIYFYMVNILRNTSLVFPGNKAVALMYEVLTTQIFLKLKEMLNLNKK